MKQSFFYKTFLTLLLGMGSIGAWAQSISLSTDKTNYQAGETIYYEVTTDGFGNAPDCQVIFWDDVGQTQTFSGFSSTGTFQIASDLPGGEYELYADAYGDGALKYTSIFINIESAINPNVSMTVSASPICPVNNAIAAQVTTTDMGSDPTYTFYIDGVYQGGTGDNFLLASQMSEGEHSIYVEVVSGSDAPIQNYTVTSSPQTVTISAIGPLPTLTLQTPVICNGTPANILLDYPSWTGGYAMWERNGVMDPNPDVFYFTAHNVSVTEPELISVTINNMECNITGQSTYTASINIQAVATPLAAPYVVSGSKTLCDGQMDSVTFALQMTGTTGNPINQMPLTYEWKTGAMVESNAPTFTTTTAGTYLLTLTDTVTGCARTSSPIVVVENPTPTVSASADGNTDICPGTSVALAATATAGAAITWKRDIATVGSAASYNAKTAGSYTAIAKLNGCSATSNAIPVTVKTTDVTVTPASSLSFCTGSSVTLNAAQNNDYSYNWFKSGAVVGTGSSYNATAAGAYTVGITNGACAEKKSAIIRTTTTTTPVATVSTAAKQPAMWTLRATGGTGLSYQWYMNGNAVGGNTREYEATVNGSYTVVVTRGACSDSLATGFPVVLANPGGSGRLSIAEEAKAISIYPNPSEGIFNIAAEEVVNVVVRDVQGKVVANITNASQVDLTNQPAGMYLMQITDLKGNMLQSERLIKK